MHAKILCTPRVHARSPHGTFPHVLNIVRAAVPPCQSGHTASVRCEAAWRDGGVKLPALLSRFFSTERAETVDRTLSAMVFTTSTTAQARRHGRLLN